MSTTNHRCDGESAASRRRLAPFDDDLRVGPRLMRGFFFVTDSSCCDRFKLMRSFECHKEKRRTDSPPESCVRAVTSARRNASRLPPRPHRVPTTRRRIENLSRIHDSRSSLPIARAISSGVRRDARPGWLGRSMSMQPSRTPSLALRGDRRTVGLQTGYHVGTWLDSKPRRPTAPD